MLHPIVSKGSTLQLLIVLILKLPNNVKLVLSVRMEQRIPMVMENAIPDIIVLQTLQIQLKHHLVITLKALVMKIKSRVELDFIKISMDNHPVRIVQ